MMRPTVLLALILLFSTWSLSAQSLIKPNWQNPEVVNVNKLPARTTSISYPTKELAIAANRDASPRKKILNGKWDFAYFEAPAKVPRGIEKPGYAYKGWKDIPVPSNWELHGYGKPWQRLTHQIWEKKGIKPPYIPQDYNPTGIYKKKISIPKDWANYQITLHVGAVSSALTVWVNGQYVGYGEDNRLPAEFDISPYLTGRNNTLVFQVSQWSDGSYLEDQDHWRMSGITRDVFLEAAPKVQLYDFAVRTELDEDYLDAELQIRPEIVLFEATDIEGWVVEAELFNVDKQPVLDTTLRVSVNKILNEFHPQIGNRPFDNLMKTVVKNPLKWSAEFPNLYTLVLSLKNQNGELMEARSTKIGFREIDISDGQFKVNGIPILLYGVNRHDWDANTGKAVTKEAMRRDAELMKQLNVNASRSSHYPNPPYWYELCDEYGIYVMDEANIESHGKGSLFSNIPSWHTTFLERGIRMVERDKNYPSIVSWSLGNEAGFGPNHAALSAWIKEFDPTRPIHAEGAQNIYGYNWPKPEPKDRIYTDFISRMYRPTEDMIDLVTKQGDNRPVIWCEYAHSQANSTGDLEGYWSAIRKYPRFVGGFVWDWRDQLIHKKSEDGRPLWAYGTDFDQNPADLNPIQKGLISADGKIKSGGWQAKYVWQRVVIKADEPASGKFSVFNRHFRTNLNEYDITWKLEKDGKLEARGTSEGVDVAPGQTGLLQLDLPQFEIEARKRYYLTISFVLKKDMPWAKKGFSVASEQFLLAYKPVRLPPSDVQVNNKGQSYELRAQGTTAVIDKNTGRLKSLKINNTEYLLSAPRPNFWRAPTDNDLASGIFDRQGVWKKSTKDMEVASVTCNGIEIEVIFKDEKGSLVTLSYSMQPNGALLLEYHFSPIADLPDIPRIGLQMTTSKELDKLVWFGRGPLETYSDKRSGALTAVYEESVRQDFAYYVRPQESGNKMGVWWFELKDESDKGIRFEAVDQPLSISAWPFSQAAIEKADRIEELEYEDIITVNIDHLQMGVGGDNTWNLDARPHEPFRISAQDYRYSFIIKGVN